MKISPIGEKNPSFGGIRKITSFVRANLQDWRISAIHAEKSTPIVVSFDVFSKTRITKRPLFKKVTQLFTDRNNLVGVHNRLPDGSYTGYRMFKDGTRFDYSTFRHETDLFGEKLGVKIDVTQKNGYRYTMTRDEAYKDNGRINIPTIKSINDQNRKTYKEFMQKHYGQIKDYLFRDLT